MFTTGAEHTVCLFLTAIIAADHNILLLYFCVFGNRTLAVCLPATW